MTVGRTEETCEGQRKEASGGDMKRPLSVTALSTIAVQSGQTQIVVSVLKSGSSVHLQLVHVQPRLCEIGSDQEENQTLIREHKQLLEKLQKHEGEVLLSVEKKRVEQRRQRQDGWMCEDRQEEEEEEGVYRAMENSLKEGWALLLRLLDARLHALTLAADFYCAVHEFAAGIERLRDLEIPADRLHNAQLTYMTIRRDLLGKSLQLLGISSDLLKKLRELQKTEALQRQGRVLQEGGAVEEESSRGCVRRLEQMLETLQDRRRTVDHDVKLRLQQAQNHSQIHPHDRAPGEKDDWSLSLDEILAQNPPSTSETESDVELKTQKEKIPPELPQVSSNPTRTEDAKFHTSSDLTSTASGETLDLPIPSKLAAEEELRVESRMGEREPTPNSGFEGSPETASENTSTKSLESSTEELTQELPPEDFMNIEPVSDIEQDSESISKDCHTENMSDQRAEDVFEEKIQSENNSDMNYDKRQSDTKSGLLSRSLPILNFASLKLQPKLQETKDLIVSTSSYFSTKPELEQECEDEGEKVVESSNCEFDNVSIGLEAKSESQVHDIESSLNESQDGELKVHSNIVKEENLTTTISDSNLDSQAKWELHSRYLPVFNLVSTKLQPKLQESKDLITINADEASTCSEEKQKSEANKRLAANHQSKQHTSLDHIKESKEMEEVEVNKTENTKEFYVSSSLNNNIDLNIQSSHKSEVRSDEKIAAKEDQKSPISPPDTDETERNVHVSKSESFSQRFKNLQTKWQENCNLSNNSDLAPKFESVKTHSSSFNVKNVNVKSKEHSKNVLKTEGLKESGITAEKCFAGEKTVKTPPPEEHLEELFAHKTEPRPFVETEVEVESTTEEKYEFKLENSPTERIVCLEEIQKLETSFEQLADKVSVWLDGCRSVLSVSSHPGPCFSEAQHSLTTHVQLRSEAQTAGVEAESMAQMLAQLQSLCSDSQEESSVNPKLSARAEVILRDLSAVSASIQSNIELLQPFVIFLQTAEEVLVDFEHLKRTYERPEVEEAMEEERWQTALQKFITAHEQGNTYQSHVGEMMGPRLNSESAADAVMEAMERLKTAKDEVGGLRKQYQTQMLKLREDKLCCLKYRERFQKTVSDLQCVSELLDSCTIMDLGSEQHTSRLQQQFTQARPHFTQLDAEANFITSNFETVRRLQHKHRLSEDVTEEDVSALLDLQLRVKQKVEESESILELSSSLHLMNKQLEDLLQSKPTASGQTGCAEEKLNHLKEEKEQMHNLLNRASNLKRDICDGIRNCSVAGFQVRELQCRLQCVEAECVSWLSEAAQCEEVLLREMKTQALLKDIRQLRDSFKDLKKRFGNLKFNYLKRNDRSRNIKAVRNQVQQVDMYEDKLQSLRSRQQILTARMHSEGKEWGGPWELEDPLNELHRQMGECERNIREHHKTLDMTCTLQEAMDEYQFWSEEASGTISRVGKFSGECHSPEAVSALYRQFEKFVWPTVPQQEERISQITELATRLHGAEEGQRYIEKTVGKHSEMVSAIRKLSDGLLELEAKLKLESINQKDEEEVIKDEESFRQMDTEVNPKETKDEEKVKPKEQVDNRTAHEAAEMYELKETGHTPELSTKHDGKEIPVRRLSFNKKPPLQKNRTHETDRKATSSFCSTHTFSLSCSPLESNRQVYAIISQSQPAIPTQTFPPPRDTKKGEKDAADSQLDTEFHPQHDILSEDSLSTDEYDCPSPDDISLPPLGETPESYLVQSDLEEGSMCFSSQYIYRSQAQSEYRESSESNLHSVSRVRTESGTFVPSPVTIPIQVQVQSESTTTVCSITTEENSIITPAQNTSTSFESKNIPPQSSTSAEPILLVHTHEGKNTSQNVTFTPSSIHTAEEISNLHPENNLPKAFPACQNSIQQEIICLDVTKLSSPSNISEECTKSQIKHILEDIEVPSTGINEPTIISHSTQLHNEHLEHNPGSSDSDVSIGQVFQSDVESSANGPTTETVTCQENKCLTTTIPKETLYSQSSMTSTKLVQRVKNSVLEETLSSKASRHKNVIGDLTPPGIIDYEILGHELHEQSIDCEEELTSQSVKEVPSHKSLASNFSYPSQELLASSTQKSDSIHHLNLSSNTMSNTTQNHQTVDSFHETSTQQQCVHDSGFSAQLGAIPLPKAKAQALAQPANMHVTPSFTSNQLLTPDQDPDICQPCTIREEITLTPQIKGPSRPPHDQDESSCFTKPVSKATVMGGSPVMLEVEVTAHPEPTLTWWVAYNQLHKYT